MPCITRDSYPFEQEIANVESTFTMPANMVNVRFRKPATMRPRDFRRPPNENHSKLHEKRT